MAHFSTGDRRRQKNDRLVTHLLQYLKDSNFCSCSYKKVELVVCYHGMVRRSTELSLVIRQTMEACILTEVLPHSQVFPSFLLSSEILESEY